ncbi:hypothetical protein AB3S75_044137 [Citrus x aurantiifolia]
MSDILPDDVVIDIISRLPVKSLLRFQFASKPCVTGREVSSPCGTPASHTTRVSLEEVAQCRLVSPCLGLIRRTAPVPNQCGSGFS